MLFDESGFLTDKGVRAFSEMHKEIIYDKSWNGKFYTEILRTVVIKKTV